MVDADTVEIIAWFVSSNKVCDAEVFLKLLSPVEAIEKTGGKAIYKAKKRRKLSIPSDKGPPTQRNQNILLKSFGGTVRARSKVGRISEIVVRSRISSPLVNLSHYKD